MRRAADPDPGQAPGLKSANERLRARWGSQLAWSTVAAVAAHAALLVFSPVWEASFQTNEPLVLEANRLFLLPLWGDATRAGAPPLAPTLVVGDEDTTEPDAGIEEGAALVGADPDELWDALGERLRRRDMLVPTIVEIESEPRAEETVSEEEGAGATVDDGDPTIGGDASLSDLAIMALQDSLRLDRLSALRPDLAFMAASAWVLIQNPTQVADFMGRGYRDGTLDGSVSGTVAVTLWIDGHGSVEWAEVTESSGRQELDEYALELFNEVVDFRPARERGVAVSRSVTLSLHFPW